MSDRLRAEQFFEALKRAAEPLVQGAHIRWQCDVRGGELLCNRDTLVGALLNLIENSLQSGGAAVGIKIHLFRRADRLYLNVSDNGPGMDQATLARLGEAFFTSRTTGTGLGLAVVKAVIRAHRGELRIRSKPGRGTSVCVVLPWAEVSHSCGGQSPWQ